ncbi:MAG: hypothetical protein IKA06_03930 [Clostridia bacterium]|nr:hypothetical protein [Clostridia bacterium]
MTNRKKIAGSAIAMFCALLLGLGAFFGIRAYQNRDWQFTVADTLPDGEGKSATVILLGGQSNASGCSRDDYLKKNVSAEKYAEYEAGYDNVYINYYATGTNESRAFVKCATKQGERIDFEGFGPELGLAEKLHAERPNETFFIIKCAWGGTDLFGQWLSPSSDGETGELYKAFVKYVKTSIKYLRSKNYDVKIEAMCWMQGESDSFSTEHATGYAQHLRNLIADIRDEFSRYAADDGIAFIDACIADNPVYWVFCDMVNASKQQVAGDSPLNVLIDTNAEGLTTKNEPEENPDQAHYDALSEIKLGHLFGTEVLKFCE